MGNEVCLGSTPWTLAIILLLVYLMSGFLTRTRHRDDESIRMVWQKALSDFRGELCFRGRSESSDPLGKLKAAKQVSQNTCVRGSRSFVVIIFRLRWRQSIH
jgi:hypothetical protein